MLKTNIIPPIIKSQVMPKKRVLGLENRVDKLLISVDPKSKFEAKKDDLSMLKSNITPDIIISQSINEPKVQQPKKDVSDIKKHIEEELISSVKKDTKSNIISQVIPITPDIITSQDISINHDIIKSQVIQKVQSKKKHN